MSIDTTPHLQGTRLNGVDLEAVGGLAQAVNADPEKAQTARLSWLTDPRLRAFYFANPDPARFCSWTEHDSIQLYGLPMSRPTKHSDTVAQRFQRAVLQRSSIEEHGLHRGDDIVVFRSGELLRQLVAGISGAATALQGQ
jgi:hypothetical protein